MAAKAQALRHESNENPNVGPIIPLETVGFKSRIIVGGQPYTHVHLSQGDMRKFTITWFQELQVVRVTRPKNDGTVFTVWVPIGNCQYLEAKEPAPATIPDLPAA